MSDAPIRVLLVDDDEDDYIITRELISQIRNRQYVLNWANSYDAAMAAMKQHEYDIGLLDYRLGERTGLELLRESQSLSGRPPMILLTGQGDHEIDVEATKAGAADYLIKSQLDADKLERAIRYSIQGVRGREHLRRERDLISRIMETSPVGIIVADRSGKITFANHRAEQVLGLDRNRIGGGAYSVLEWTPTDLEGNPLGNQAAPLKHVLASGRPVQDVCYAVDGAKPPVAAHPKSRRTLLSTNATPLFNGAGEVDGMVVTIEDISERLTLEAQLRQSQKMESVGQLAAGVAHDINNILTVIQGHTGLLLNAAPANGDSVKSLKQIAAASERAAGFIRQLLTFSRKQIFQSKILDLNKVLRNLQNMLPQMLGEDIALETHFDPELPQVEADTGMVEQIVMNLVVNARDAMPKGGKLVMTTTLEKVGVAHARQFPEARPGQFVCLSVADTGCGMDAKVLPRIFEPFFTTKDIGRGTGLGLATVYGIVKQHQGWIQVQSEVGAGSTFRIFFPIPGEIRNAPPTPVAGTENVRGGKESILLVEDEPGLLELIRSVLEEYHYHVLTASSGSEAIQVWDASNGQVDLLLTDMIMPGGMTGSDLANELKKHKPALRVIYTSGYSAELAGKDFGLRETTFLAKPYLPSQLAETVRRCLDEALQGKSGGSHGSATSCHASLA